MRYYICEGDTSDGKYNATSKAREDAEFILNKMDFKPLFVATKEGVFKHKIMKIFQFFTYFKNTMVWIKDINKLQNGDIVLIQYPIMFGTLFFKKVLKKMRKKNVTSIALIHDLNNLRLGEVGGVRYKRSLYEDKNIVKEYDFVISHNNKMTKLLLEYGVKKDKIVNLGIFDYISDCKIDRKKRDRNKPVIIAGNLSSEKAGFLKELNTFKNVKFNLYGKGLDIQVDNNINYAGCYLPSELSENLDGSFGLVWDGSTIEKIDGCYGNYMKYNNPHKISLYLVSQLPVIVSSESALADFVTENNLGITVKSLRELDSKLKKISEKQYDEMLTNVRNISKRIKCGYYLTTCINEILNK